VKSTRTNEPLAWLLFSAGGVLAAMALPVLLLLLGVAVPFGWVAPPRYDRLAWLLGNPMVRLGLLALCSTSLLHWAHRFRYTLYDGLQLKHLHEGINFACYGGAILGSLVAAYLLFVVL
jgi:succinate dehydrogenase subunit D